MGVVADAVRLLIARSQDDFAVCLTSARLSICLFV